MGNGAAVHASNDTLCDRTCDLDDVVVLEGASRDPARLLSAIARLAADEVPLDDMTAPAVFRRGPGAGA